MTLLAAMARSAKATLERRPEMSETAEKETWRCEKELDVRAKGLVWLGRVPRVLGRCVYEVSLSVAVSRRCLGSV